MKTNKKSTDAAIATIAAQMIKTAKRSAAFDCRVAAWAQEVPADVALDCVAADFVRDATEYFTDCAEATRDMILAGVDGLTYAARQYSMAGFSGITISNLARATVIYLDEHGRCSDDYVEGVASALMTSPSNN